MINSDVITVENDFIDMRKTAVFSKDMVFRYKLSRMWKAGGFGRIVFIMLNPSTADAMIEDPTIRRCMVFARKWGYRVLDVANAFALRSTDPLRLQDVSDPIGPLNDQYLREMTETAERVVVAWGTHGKLQDRGNTVAKRVLHDRILHCLAVTKHGFPKHPLYMRGDTEPTIYRRTG